MYDQASLTRRLVEVLTVAPAAIENTINTLVVAFTDRVLQNGSHLVRRLSCVFYHKTNGLRGVIGNVDPQHLPSCVSTCKTEEIRY